MSLSTMITIPFSISPIYEKQNKLTKVNLHFIHHTSEIDNLLCINNVSSLDFPTEQRNIRNLNQLRPISTTTNCWRSTPTRQHLPRTNHYSTTTHPLCHHGGPNRKPALLKQGYLHFDTILPFRDHNTVILYLLYYIHFYTIIIFNSPTTVIILNGNFIDVHEISLTKTKTLYIV